jgi:hypothetical protein
VLATLVPLWALAAVLLGGIPTVAKWFEESTERLKANKPLVLTERTENGGYELRNAGGALAVNVWYVPDNARSKPVPMGSMTPNERRRIYSPTERHLILAESRPRSGRRWTPSMNVISGPAVCHGFAMLQDPTRECSITQLLQKEKKVLDLLWQWKPGDPDCEVKP